ncbi:hypothetical protein ACQPZP_41680 [Spirillospora sp. CA-142024]|uniref:hypothetical protein n=1 Tax=Spirillospora sp. CA-142024 TaxID=3240036 RepID=UPI003D8FCB51
MRGFIQRMRQALPDASTPEGRARQSKIAAAAVVFSLVLGQVGTTVLIKTGVNKESAVITGFLTYTVASLVFWGYSKPRLRASWSLWWRALLLGGMYAANVIASREALGSIPDALMTTVFFFGGPFFVALIRGRSRVTRYVLPTVAIGGVALVAKGWHGTFHPASLAWIGVMALNYYVYVTVTSRLKRKYEDGGDDQVNACISLSRIPSVVFLAVLFFRADGVNATIDLGRNAVVVCVIVGILSGIGTIIANLAWNLGLQENTHALLQPTRPTLSLFGGWIAGQKPLSASDWLPIALGVTLVTAAGLGATKAEIRNRQAVKA